MPDTKTLPPEILLLVRDTDHYIVKDLPLTELIRRSFIEGFVKKGNQVTFRWWIAWIFNVITFQVPFTDCPSTHGSTLMIVSEWPPPAFCTYPSRKTYTTAWVSKGNSLISLTRPRRIATVSVSSSLSSFQILAEITIAWMRLRNENSCFAFKSAQFLSIIQMISTMRLFLCDFWDFHCDDDISKANWKKWRKFKKKMKWKQHSSERSMNAICI